MCGIVGLIDLHGERAVDEALLARMNLRLAHRGPDQDGLHVEPGVGLGHRRLSIIDLAGGVQPLYNEDRSVVVVYNGEIYNFATLATELQALGHRFRTHCDTEVIVHAWEAWGAECVHRFRGMFAFAVWDRNRQTAFLARDRLGIKPLYYAQLADGWLLFGSELKALELHPGLVREVDPQAVEEYFAYGYVPDPRSIYAGTSKLAPGHVLEVRRGHTLAPRRYWDLHFQADAGMGEAAASDELRARLQEAVRVRLVAEVPLGAFLSGGVDSSAVVATMAGLLGDPVNTCSIGFPDRDYDESRYALAVAQRYRTAHQREEVDPDDFALLDRLAELYDEPYADSSAMPTYRVCELARRRVTVALSGDGGDEVLAGYRRYRWQMNEQRVRAGLPQWLRGPLFGALGRAYPKLDWAPRWLRAKSTFQSLARDPVEGYFHSVSLLGDDLRSRLFTSSFRQRLGAYRACEVLRAHAARGPQQDALAQVQYLDLMTYLPGDILTKVDRASMAHGLEVRVPFLDHHFVEWAATLPQALKLHGGEGKYLLKRAMEPALPAELLYRQKMGFAVPLGSWFRGPLRERARTALLGDAMRSTGLFDMRFIAMLLDLHAQGRRDFSAPIWSLLMFEAFLRRSGVRGVA